MPGDFTITDDGTIEMPSREDDQVKHALKSGAPVQIGDIMGRKTSGGDDKVLWEKRAALKAAAKNNRTGLILQAAIENYKNTNNDK